MTNTYSPFI
ncbi:Protein of unknown function [Bacillus thuringiensis]|uniref:Uncharacterized protein n=1 Tax=Bacillus thuringiensis TaxID=1428 RepID=A0A1C4CKE2_BACTU|nr:Protein of unknown function [Bacillus thuringiensis]